MPKSISCIIPTYNRRERLAKVLTALDSQLADPGGLEVLVVDDGSTDGTFEWLAQQRYRFELRPLRQVNQGPARARNAGIDAAKGELLLFLDDDVVPDPELVSEHQGCHALEENLVVIGPLVSLEHYAQPWVAWEQSKLEAQYAAMQRGDWEPTYRQFWTGNASVGREHVLAAGKFNVAFLRGEDVELGFRLAERGLRFRFNANARGLHHAERTLESWENAHRSYGRLEVQLFSLRSERDMLSILAGNWSRLHSSVRALLEFCAVSPLGYRAFGAVLRRYIKLSPFAQNRYATERALSALANLLYWQASFDRLGPKRAREVRRHGEELRRAALKAQAQTGPAVSTGARPSAQSVRQESRRHT